MPSAGFELTISAGEGPQTNALDRAATGAGIQALLASQSDPRTWSALRK
jgi:hypothetical protein